MNNRKEAIYSRYNEVADIQKISAKYLVETLISKLQSEKIRNILDIGCGTGYVAEFLVKHFSNANFTLNDITLNMINFVRSKFKDKGNFSFLCEDMDILQPNFHDLITSNFCFQWSNNLYLLLEKLFSYCNIFSFSCLIEPTFAQWRQRIKYIAPGAISYPKENELLEFCKNLNPKEMYTQKRVFSKEFSNPAKAINYLRYLGANGIRGELDFIQLNHLIKNDHKKVVLEYHVKFVILKR